MSAFTDAIKPIFVYTMTSGLGDFVIMGDLARKVERLIPTSRVIFVHRGNPHVNLWPDDGFRNRFINVYSLADIVLLSSTLLQYRKTNFRIFGLQMAPGSVQGYLFLKLLKKLGLINYVVDFNLINADIITPPKGNYILDLHLNQIAKLTGMVIPPEDFHLDIPFEVTNYPTKTVNAGTVIGIHPWSRRGYLPSFVWQDEKWCELLQHLLQKESDIRIVVFGRDERFDMFEHFLRSTLSKYQDRIEFVPSNNVISLAETIVGLDLIISVNTAVVHIGYALKKYMIILSGPSLDLWVPKNDKIITVQDSEALFQASDKWTDDGFFCNISRISTVKVIATADVLLKDIRESE